MKLNPQTFRVKSETLALRCEVCHLADCFDPTTGDCARCSGIRLPETDSGSVPQLSDTRPPIIILAVRKISQLMLYCLYGIGGSLLFCLVSAILQSIGFSPPGRVFFLAGISLLALSICLLTPLICLYFFLMTLYVTFDVCRELYRWARSLMTPTSES